jgi:hypothetical protein
MSRWVYGLRMMDVGIVGMKNVADICNLWLFLIPCGDCFLRIGGVGGMASAFPPSSHVFAFKVAMFKRCRQSHGSHHMVFSTC